MNKALTALALLVPVSLFAQTPAATVDPGMSREQVIAKLGEPLSSRTYESFTYMLYKNGCEKKCGMNDLVVLDSGKVVDAVFRSPDRHYRGTSSSPRMIPAAVARRGKTASVVTPAASPAPARKPAVDSGGTGRPPKKPGA
jgi:hypothetical protein